MIATEALDLFNAPRFIYEPNVAYNFMGHAGDMSIGEYIYFYVKTETNESIITEIRYSIIGSVYLIAIAEKFCALIKGKNINTALSFCDESNIDLIIPDERKYLFNFVIQAFYEIVEGIMNIKQLNPIIEIK